LVQATWERLLAKVGGRDITYWWNFMSAGLRQYLRGWNQNLSRDTKATKAAMLTQIAQLDVLADATGLDEDAWASRYHMEEQLLHITELKRNTGGSAGKSSGPYMEMLTQLIITLWLIVDEGNVIFPLLALPVEPSWTQNSFKNMCMSCVGTCLVLQPQGYVGWRHPPG
jgi:hypothetical protein